MFHRSELVNRKYVYRTFNAELMKCLTGGIHGWVITHLVQISRVFILLLTYDVYRRPQRKFTPDDGARVCCN